MSSTTGPPPNYYAILEISETASTTQIRDAYKRAALKTHPDRVPTDHPERRERTRKFQLVNDAYYTLSDTTRRREYDAQRKLYSSPRGGGSTYTDPFAQEPPPYTAHDDHHQGGGAAGAAESAYSWAWNFFTGQNGNKQNAQEAQQERQQTENAQFADVFEEMLREQGMDGTGQQVNNGGGKFWGTLGGLSGGALGFIVANVPGLVAGAVAGNRLGAVRDAKGKSVYAVFQELPQDDRSRLLSQLAAKVFSHAVGI